MKQVLEQRRGFRTNDHATGSPVIEKQYKPVLAVLNEAMDSDILVKKGGSTCRTFDSVPKMKILGVDFFCSGINKILHFE